MFYIWYEYLSEAYPRFRVYKIREWHQIMPYVLHENLIQIGKQSSEYPKYEHYFMLDESRFWFFRFDIFQTCESGFTYEDLKNIIDEKCKFTKKQNDVDGERIMAYIDTIYVNWESKNFVIWEKWEVFFRLYIVYVNKVTINSLNSAYWNIFNVTNISIIPESFQTMLFLRNNLKKENFVILYINEISCKAIKIQKWFYDSVFTLNLWLSALKQMYKDNWIVQYRYKDSDFIEANPLAKSLVVETLDFYSDLFCKRLFEKNLIWNDVIVISEITNNVHFLDTFNANYRKITNNYIVPFHHSDTLNNFDIKREPEDMDTIVLINREEKIRKYLDENIESINTKSENINMSN